MPDFAHSLNFLRLVIIILMRPHFSRWHKRLRKRWQAVKQRQWKPGTPHDCALCCQQMRLQVSKQRAVVPYAQSKSPRGRKRSVATHGFACPNADCAYCGITTSSVI
jgi:hypothetical protein